LTNGYGIGEIELTKGWSLVMCFVLKCKVGGPGFGERKLVGVTIFVAKESQEHLIKRFSVQTYIKLFFLFLVN